MTFSSIGIKKEEAGSKRDKTRQFINMHDELFSATYERNDIFDLTTAEIIENYKNNAHSN